MAYKYKWVGSPNFTRKFTKRKITKIVIHWMVGTLASTDVTFSRRGSGVSAHYGVEGNNVHQYVKDNNIAWHAISGNPFSIGIEHSAAPGRKATDATYATTAELIASACRIYGLNPDRDIVPHCLYVQTRCPGTDKNGKVREPGGMDIGRIKRDVKRILGSKPTAKPASKPQPAPKPPTGKKTNEQIADEVMAGAWGNNPERSTKLQRAGYNPNAIQALVNRKLGF